MNFASKRNIQLSGPATVAVPVRNPIWLIVFTAVTTMSIVFGLGVKLYQDLQQTDAYTTQHHRIEQLRGRLSYLDAGLSLSVQMAAVAGETRWVQQYQRIAKKYNDQVTHTYQTELEALLEVDLDRAILNKIESTVLIHIADLDFKAAQAILQEASYLSAQKSYRRNLHKFVYPSDPIQHIEKLRNTIIRLDEVLTMSARLAASTGKPEWEERYRLKEQVLDEAIHEAERLTQLMAGSDVVIATDVIADINQSNLALIDIEHQAFELIHRGELIAADTLLNSQKYEAQKKNYADAMRVFSDWIEGAINNKVKSNQFTMWLTGAAMILVLMLISVIWWIAMRTVNRWCLALERNEQELTTHSDELEMLTTTLEQRVVDRTEKLEESQRRYRQLVDNSSVINYLASVSDIFSIIYMNPQFGYRLGLPAGCWQDDPQIWYKSIHAEDQIWVAEAIRHALIHGQSFRIEYRMIAASGDVLWFQDEANLVSSESSQALHYQGVMIEITARKKSETSLVRYQEIVATTDDMMAFVNTEYRILVANQAYASSFGKSVNDVVDHDLSDIVGADVFERTFKHQIDLGLTGKTLSFRYDFQLPTGYQVSLDVRLLPAHNHAEEINGVVMDIRDITEQQQIIELLRLSGERFELVVRGAREGIWDYDLVTGDIYLSPQWKKHLGYSDDEINNSFTSWQELIHPDDLGHLLEVWLESMEGTRERFDIEYRLKSKYGEWRWIECRGIALKDSSGQPIRLAGSHLDVTERRQMQQTLLSSRATFRNVVERSADGAIIVDTAGIVRFVNTAAASIFGKTAKELLGEPFGLPLTTDRGIEIDIIRSSHKHGIGEMFAVESEWEGDPAYLISVRDITERKLAAEKISQHAEDLTEVNLELAAAHEREHQLATHDSVTGLPNRMLFLDRLRQAIILSKRDSQLTGVLFIDLDRFKIINDTLGHDAGDFVLCEIATRLEHHGRESDTVARLGGDEFVIVLLKLKNAQEAGKIAQKIIKSLKSPVMYEDQELLVGASIGISISPADGVDSESLIKNADTAMYKAKHNGRNNYQFYSIQ